MNMKFFIIIIFFSILSSSGIAESTETLPVYKLSVSFDMENSLLNAAAHITFPDDGTRDILTGDLRIIAVTFNGQPFVPEIKDGVFKISGKGTLEIIYEGYFQEEQQVTEIEELENVGVVSKNIISSKGISLTSNWYPSFEGMTDWNLTVLLPEGFIAISEADGVDVSDTDQGTDYVFHFPYPLSQIHLVAGTYTEQHESHRGV